MPKNRFFDPRFKWPAILTAGVLLLPTPSAAMRNIQPANNTGLEAQIALELRAGLESPAPAPEVFFNVQSKTDRLQTLLEGIKQRTGYDVSDPANSIRLIQDTAWYGRSWFDNGRVSVIPLFPDSADRTRKLVVSYKHGHWDTYEADRVSAYPGSASPELRREWETPDGTFGGRFSHWDVPVKVTYQLNQEVLARQVRISLDSDANEGLLMSINGAETLEGWADELLGNLAAVVHMADDAENFSLPETLDLPFQVDGLQQATDMAFSEYTQRLYVLAGRDVLELDAASGQVLDRHTVLKKPNASARLEMDSDGKTLFLLSGEDEGRSNSGSIRPIDLRTNAWGSPPIVFLRSSKPRLSQFRDITLNSRDRVLVGLTGEENFYRSRAGLLRSETQTPVKVTKGDIRIAYNSEDHQYLILRQVQDDGYHVVGFDAKEGSASGLDIKVSGVARDIVYDRNRRQLLILGQTGVQIYDFKEEKFLKLANRTPLLNLGGIALLNTLGSENGIFLLDQLQIGRGDHFNRLQYIDRKTGQFSRPAASGLESIPTVTVLTQEAEAALSSFAPEIMFSDLDDTFFIGDPDREQMQLLGDAFGVAPFGDTDGFFEELADSGGTIEDPEVYLVPGSTGFLRRLQIPTVISTSAEETSRTEIIGLLGIADWIDDLKGDGQKAQRIREILHARDLRPDQAFMMGNESGDIRAGREAGVLTVAFARSEEAYRTFEKAVGDDRPDVIIYGDFESIDEIAAQLYLPMEGASEAVQREEAESEPDEAASPQASAAFIQAEIARMDEEAEQLWDKIQAIRSADPDRPLVVIANETDGDLVVKRIRSRLDGAGIQVVIPHIGSSDYHEDTSRVRPEMLPDSFWQRFAVDQPHVIFVDGKKNKGENRDTPDSFWFPQNAVDVFNWWAQAPTAELDWSALPERSWHGDVKVKQIVGGPRAGQWSREGSDTRLRARQVSLSFDADGVTRLLEGLDRAQGIKSAVQPYRLVATEPGLLRRQAAGDRVLGDAGWPPLDLGQLNSGPQFILHRTDVFFERKVTVAGQLEFDERIVPADLSGGGLETLMDAAWVEQVIHELTTGTAVNKRLAENQIGEMLQRRPPSRAFLDRAHDLIDPLVKNITQPYESRVQRRARRAIEGMLRHDKLHPVLREILDRYRRWIEEESTKEGNRLLGQHAKELVIWDARINQDLGPRVKIMSPEDFLRSYENFTESTQEQRRALGIRLSDVGTVMIVRSSDEKIPEWNVGAYVQGHLPLQEALEQIADGKKVGGHTTVHVRPVREGEEIQQPAVVFRQGDHAITAHVPRDVKMIVLPKDQAAAVAEIKKYTPVKISALAFNPLLPVASLDIWAIEFEDSEGYLVTAFLIAA